MTSTNGTKPSVLRRDFASTLPPKQFPWGSVHIKSAPTNRERSRNAVVGCNLEPILEEMGLDYSKFSEAMDREGYGFVTAACISRYAKGGVMRFDSYSIVTICRALGIELGDLLYIEEFDTPNRTVPLRNMMLRFIRQLAEIGNVIELGTNPKAKEAFEALRNHLAAICIDEALQPGDALLQSPSGDVVYVYGNKIPDFCEFYQLNNRDVQRLIAGETLTCKKWTLLKSAKDTTANTNHI